MEMQNKLAIWSGVCSVKVWGFAPGNTIETVADQ